MRVLWRSLLITVAKRIALKDIPMTRSTPIADPMADETAESASNVES